MKGMIFIDGGNLFHSSKECSIQIDLEKLSKFLYNKTGLKSLLRTYYYTGVPVNISNKQAGFLTKIDHLPNFEVKKKTLKIIKI